MNKLKSNYAVGGQELHGKAPGLSGASDEEPGDRVNIAKSLKNVPQIVRSLSLPIPVSTTGLHPSTALGGFRDRSPISASSTQSPMIDGEVSSFRSEYTSASIVSPLTTTTSISHSNGEVGKGDVMKREPLVDQIYNRLQDCVILDDTFQPSFLPATAIEDIVDTENIQAELDGISPEDVSNILLTRRKLFIILVMQRQSKIIYTLMKEGIHDAHLPFLRDPKNNMVLLCKSLNEVPESRVVESLKAHGDEWSRMEINDFYNRYQWRVIAPHFNINCLHSNSSAAEAEHRRFLKFEILPITKPSGDTGDILYYSKLSMVIKVYIHPAHRNCSLPSVQQVDCFETPFALKVIDEASDRDMAENEIDKLKRFYGQKYQQRLIRLLCSFEYQRKFYLVFPWADANLEEFWRVKFPEVGSLPRGCGLARWMARELLGLAQGLHLIHNPPPKNQGDKRTNGRHGDIKPENILWFRDDEESECHGLTDSNITTDETARPAGMLKISDFGFVDFRTKGSVSKIQPNSIRGLTHTYCAPECDSTPEERISQRYDCWSLGCVLLQFVTWYAQGWDGVEEFATRRSTLEGEYERGEMWEDRFFQRDRHTKEVSVKPAVYEFMADMLLAN
ncbi:unnamed protein product [Clonostachys solani]|uniref:Protein kinase domain-containing protein n=1 Tax=Clonostachys solani TaxID=160281 RepID=A0A9N9ZNH8_9HYPO|nr:unnamed protein product [Clonostachys solani]